MVPFLPFLGGAILGVPSPRARQAVPVVPVRIGSITPLCRGTVDPASWPLPRLAASLLVVPVDEGAPGSVAPEVAAGAGGVILTGGDATSGLRNELAALALRAPAGLPPLVMTDEEGGAVQRLTSVLGPVPAPRTMGATMRPAAIRVLAARLGQKMRRLGVTMDLAPVLDVDGGIGPSSSNPDGTRSFSPSVATASAAGIAFARGLEQAGVLPVVKHFPGLGGASGNTDVEVASTLPYSRLETGGLVPFERAVAGGLPAVMIANATVPGLTRLPASLSPVVVTTLLRKRLGFTGLVVTDSLSAVSVSAAGYDVPAAAVAALAAGDDLLLFNATPGTVASLTRQIVATIEGAVRSGRLSRSMLEAAATHVLAAKRLVACRP